MRRLFIIAATLCNALLVMFLILVMAAYYADQATRPASPDARALACARASIGTDSAIADCYTRHGLPAPSDI